MERTSFELPVFILYICRKTFNASSSLFITRRNFGLSGRTEKVIVFMKFIIAITIMYNLHGTKCMNHISILQFIGINRIAKIEEYINVMHINIEVNEAALGAVSFV